MNAETLNCNNCGAPLSVPAAAKYATCTGRQAARGTQSTNHHLPETVHYRNLSVRLVASLGR